MQTAQDIMTVAPTTIGSDATLKDAIDLLLDAEVSGLPVVDEHHHLFGLITEFALLAAVYDRGVLQDSVKEHMTEQVMTVKENDPIKTVVDLFILHRIRRVPVTSDGKLVGIISRRDVLRAARSEGKELSNLSPFTERAQAMRSS